MGQDYWAVIEGDLVTEELKVYGPYVDEYSAELAAQSLRKQHRLRGLVGVLVVQMQQP